MVSITGAASSALKYDFAADDGYVGLDVLDLIFRHGQVVRREDHQVGQLSWLKRTLPPFFERVTCSRTRIEAQSLFAADGFGCAVNVAVGVLPRHHDVHIEQRVDRIDRKIGSSSEIVDAHLLDQSLCRHGTVRSRAPEEALYGRGLVPHEHVLKIDPDSQPVSALHLFGPDQACMDEDEAPVADRLFPVRSLERVEYMVDTQVAHDVYAGAPIVSVAD